MRSSNKLFILLTASGILFLHDSCSRQPGSQSPMAENSDFETKVAAYVKPYQDLGGFSGSILMAKGGEILVNKGYGMANYELRVPNTPQSKFQIASVSKGFTSAAILILEEKGLISVEDPLHKFIPDYPGGERITIHHLLTHTSGIPNVNNFPDYDEKSRFPSPLENIIAMFKNKPLEFVPGEKYSYSNSNYNLLAYIVEKAAGKSYGEFLKASIFDPLEMKDTGHNNHPEALLINRASGYVPAGAIGLENAPYLDWSIKTGNGSLYSTVEDLYKWDRALYSEKVLKKASLEKMFKEHVPGIGYGWFLRDRIGRRVTDDNGRSPGFTSYLERFVNDDACIIVLSNNYAPAPHIMINDLAAILFGEKYETPDIKPTPVDPKIMEPYIGRYEFGPGYYRPGAVVSVERNGQALIMKWSETYVSWLTPLSDRKFFDRLFWAWVTFEKNLAGEVTQLVWRDTQDYPAKKL